MYIYEGHMGGLYTSDDVLDYEDTYCEECGDSDWLIGHANTREDAWNLLKDDTDIDGLAVGITTMYRNLSIVIGMSKGEVNYG